MRSRLAILVFLSFFFNACDKANEQIPNITQEDIDQADLIQQTLQEEINKGELVTALETSGDFNQNGVLVSGIIKRLTRLILPDHLEFFDVNHAGLNEKNETFAEYKGKYGRCHQFRVFYKYKDPRYPKVEWASSILSVPAKRRDNVKAGVVLAPTLDGFTPFIESGLWLQLCGKGVATLMPESLYNRDQKGLWNKTLFDPTPRYKRVDEYDLYEFSIRRYEEVLNRNIKILRNFGKILTTRDNRMSDLNIMQVTPKRVGFWGSSFGAVVGSLVVAKDKSIKAAVLTVGGGDLPHVIARSKIGLFENTRKQQMKILGLNSLDEYEEFIAQYIQSDPLNFAHESDADRLYMIVAKQDRSVPSISQYALLEKFGTPQHSQIHSNHVLTLLMMSWFKSPMSKKAMDSLVKKLK